VPPPALDRSPPTRYRLPLFWLVAASTLTVATVALCVVLIRRPELGLDLTWTFAVPALPLVFLLAPRVWRNVCPFALANQIPRMLGLSRARAAPGWIAEHGFTVAALAFVCLVVLHKMLLDRSGPATAVVLVAFMAAASVGGLLVRGKAGWCGSVCPLYPVQRVYGRAPLVQVDHAHCRPCVECMHPCVDLDPETTKAFEDSGRREAVARSLFVGAAPGLVLGYFAPGQPAVPVATAVAAVLAPTLASALVYLLLAALLRASDERRRRSLNNAFAAAAFALFYFFAGPRLLAALGWDDVVITGAVQALAWIAAVDWWFRDQRRPLPTRGGPILIAPLGISRGQLQPAGPVVRYTDAGGALDTVAGEPGYPAWQDAARLRHRDRPSQQQAAHMLEIQRIWRITTSANGAIDVRLSPRRNGDQQLMLAWLVSDPPDEQTLDLEVARALAETMLEACEVASALSEHVAATR
jgi:hypothetical protein